MNRYHFFVLTVMLFGLVLPVSGSAQANTQEYADELAQMDWQYGPQDKQIEAINAHYELGETEALLGGEQARRVLELSEGAKYPGVNALILHGLGEGETASQTMLAHIDIGFITDEDWESLNADEVLETTKELTAEQNRQREQNGFRTLFVDGWRVPPRYDRESRTAYWALDVSTSAGGKVINAIAVKLSRDGFTRMTWVGTPAQFHGEQTLAGIGEALSFQSGYRYADYSEGDAMAGVGLAALVTGIATGP